MSENKTTNPLGTYNHGISVVIIIIKVSTESCKNRYNVSICGSSYTSERAIIIVIALLLTVSVEVKGSLRQNVLTIFWEVKNAVF